MAEGPGSVDSGSEPAGPEVANTAAAERATAEPAAPAAGERATGPAPPDPRVRAAFTTGAAAAALAGALLAGTAGVGGLALVLGLVAVQGLLAVAWVLGLRLPGRIGAVLLALAAGVSADVCASVWPHGRLGALLGVLGLAVPAMFVHQLVRGAARVRVLESLGGITVLLLTEVSLAALVQLGHEFAGADAGNPAVIGVVAAVSAGLVVGFLADLALPAPRLDEDVPRGLLGVVLATAAGAVAGHVLMHASPDFIGGRGLFVGAAVGGLAGLLAVAASFADLAVPPVDGAADRWLRPALGALVPLGLVVPVAFALCLAVRA